MTSRQSRWRHYNRQVRVNIDAPLVAIFRIAGKGKGGCMSAVYLLWLSWHVKRTLTAHDSMYHHQNYNLYLQIYVPSHMTTYFNCISANKVLEIVWFVWSIAECDVKQTNTIRCVQKQSATGTLILATTLLQEKYLDVLRLDSASCG